MNFPFLELSPNGQDNGQLNGQNEGDEQSAWDLRDGQLNERFGRGCIRPAVSGVQRKIKAVNPRFECSVTDTFACARLGSLGSH